jgi:hypothetical protein
VDTVALAPAAQTSTCVAHQSVIETFCDYAVVCEGLQFSGAVSTIAPPGQYPIKIDCLIGAPTPVA